MQIQVFGESVQGASHICSGISCQDSKKFVSLPNNIHIVSVADGHGSINCPYSKTGSEIAVNVFCDIVTDICKPHINDLEYLLTYFSREGETRISQEIEHEWKKRVLKRHSNNKLPFENLENGEKDKESIYRQYGTTLLGMVVTPLFAFAFQLGDGDVEYVDETGATPFIKGDRILGTETHSMSRSKAWEKTLTKIRILDKNCDAPFLFMISTDGFSNSFKNNEEYEKSCVGYFELIKEHGVKRVDKELKTWLNETSSMGCGDDVTLMMIYISNMTDIL